MVLLHEVIIVSLKWIWSPLMGWNGLHNNYLPTLLIPSFFPISSINLRWLSGTKKYFLEITLNTSFTNLGNWALRLFSSLDSSSSSSSSVSWISSFSLDSLEGWVSSFVFCFPFPRVALILLFSASFPSNIEFQSCSGKDSFTCNSTMEQLPLELQ